MNRQDFKKLEQKEATRAKKMDEVFKLMSLAKKENKVKS